MTILTPRESNPRGSLPRKVSVKLMLVVTTGLTTAHSKVKIRLVASPLAVRGYSPRVRPATRVAAHAGGSQRRGRR